MYKERVRVLKSDDNVNVKIRFQVKENVHTLKGI